MGAESGLVELGGPGEVGLGDQHQLGEAERGGVLERLVLALGDGGQDDAQRLTEVVGGRTDEIAHVLHEQQAGALGQPVVQVPGEHVRLQVAQPVGEHLLDRDTRTGQAGGVVLGGEVRGEGGGPDAALP
ncbi:hypothetical protein A4U61_08025 [Streptomyces sp. H-KF8]|nr:hypothetical protein A4U61_08025 [Streptomyces sp. H-KF8]